MPLFPLLQIHPNDLSNTATIQSNYQDRYLMKCNAIMLSCRWLPSPHTYTWAAGVTCGPAPASTFLLCSEDLPISIQLLRCIPHRVSQLSQVWKEKARGGSGDLAAQPSRSQMPAVLISGRALQRTSATGEPLIKWQEASQVGKGRDSKTQSMRGKRRRIEKLL